MSLHSWSQHNHVCSSLGECLEVCGGQNQLRAGTQQQQQCITVTDLPSALENGGPGPPDPLPADDISGDVHLGIHEASLLQGYVVVQICFDGGTFLGHNFGLDGCDFLHRHGFRQRPGDQWYELIISGKKWQVCSVENSLTPGRLFLTRKSMHIRKGLEKNTLIPDLVSLHNTLFVALQTSGQTLLVQTHSLFILRKKSSVQTISSAFPSFTVNRSVCH